MLISLLILHRFRRVTHEIASTQRELSDAHVTNDPSLVIKKITQFIEISKNIKNR